MSHLPCKLISGFIIRDSLNISLFIRHLPVRHKLRAMRMVNGFFPHAHAIYKQLDHRGIGAYAHVNHLPRIEVPVRKNMNHRIFLKGCPLSLINIVGILLKPCRVHLPEVAVACVIRCRFAKVIHSSPDKLSKAETGIPVRYYIVRIAVRAPSCTAVAKRRTLLIRIT